MQRLVTVVLLVGTIGFVMASSAAANPPGTNAQAQQVDIHLDDHFQSEFWSETCGVDVFIDFVADVKVTLVYNQSGLVVRETDKAGGGTITFRSPETGKSFWFPLQPTQWDYGSGAVVGSDVIISFTGLLGHVPGFGASDAGLFRFRGVVEGFDEQGIPQVDFLDFADVIADRGNRQPDSAAAICAALTDL
jgi:hypothetical protein